MNGIFLKKNNCSISDFSNKNAKSGEVFERDSKREKAGGRRPHETDQGCQNKKSALKRTYFLRERTSLWEFLV